MRRHETKAINHHNKKNYAAYISNNREGNELNTSNGMVAYHERTKIER